jgi:hypothetical protein
MTTNTATFGPNSKSFETLYTLFARNDTTRKESLRTTNISQQQTAQTPANITATNYPSFPNAISQQTNSAPAIPKIFENQTNGPRCKHHEFHTTSTFHNIPLQNNLTTSPPLPSSYNFTLLLSLLLNSLQNARYKILSLL